MATTIENQCCYASLVFTCSADDLLCTVFFILQGRALLNAIGNLELSGAYPDALRKLEDVAAGQVRYFF